MFFTRILLTILCLLPALCPASAHMAADPSDSLQRLLAQTAAPQQRIALLLNLKDLNEDTELNLSYSIQLFREAAVQNDTYAMTMAVVPIISRYAGFPEKQDSLQKCLAALRRLTPGTPEEGADAFAELNLAFNRLRSLYDPKDACAMARQIYDRATRKGDTDTPENIYHRAKRLALQGYASMYLEYYEKQNPKAYVPQIPVWEEAYRLTLQMPQPNIRRLFGNVIYFMLSGAYNQGYLYPEQKKLMESYVALLDAYYDDEIRINRRPYLYRDNSYVLPYQQLIRCALNINRNDLAAKHFEEFRERMHRAEGEDLVRNKSYFYELGYIWNANIGNYDTSILYCDSLIRLISRDEGYFRRKPYKINRVWRDRSLILSRDGRFDESFASYERAYTVQDSLARFERNNRLETIRLRNEMDRRQLDETRAQIRSHTMILISLVVLACLLIGVSVFYCCLWRRNRRLQAGILHHSLKAQESDRMKSNFVNSIFHGIRTPFHALEESVHDLMIEEDPSDSKRLLESIRENTFLLISTLDNMLEAANLDSLTDKLQLEPTDIDELCRAEVLLALKLEHGSQVEYLIDAPQTLCTIRTHPKYFAFLIRTLLAKARRSISKGRIVVSYKSDGERLRVGIKAIGHVVSDDRCSLNDADDADVSLSLCRIIIRHLHGHIVGDTDCNAGLHAVFTLPVRP